MSKLQEQAARAVRRFRVAYGYEDATGFAFFLRKKRKYLSHARRLAFSQEYVATKGDRWPS